MFFLKSDAEVPLHLKKVTGDLRTRAPSRAARKEAGEKARVDNVEEKAKFDSIMILANGINNATTNGDGLF